MSTIEKIETLSCDAGWRNYYFCKITTKDGVTGWSEYDECFGSPGVTAVIEKLGRRLIGKSVHQTERAFSDAYCATRPSFGGVTAQGAGALENALLDAKAKTLGVPCHVLLGGKIRDEIDVYWSHCATWRMSHAAHYGKKIEDLDGVREAGREARDAGFRALKTNLFSYEAGGPRAYRAGFGVPFEPGLNVTPKLIRQIRAHLEAILEGAGEDCEVLLDLNFNFRTEGCLRILRALEDLPLFWVEIDSYNAEALAYIRQQSRHPISSCETLIGIREFMPFLTARSMDVGIVDTCLLYTSPSPRDRQKSRMPSSA